MNPVVHVLEATEPSLEARGGLVRKTAERIEDFLGASFPAEQGYRVRRSTGNPFVEARPGVEAQHVRVLKGFLWGLCVCVAPEDAEVHRIRITIQPCVRLEGTCARIPWVLGYAAAIVVCAVLIAVAFLRPQGPSAKAIFLCVAMAGLGAGLGGFLLVRLIVRPILRRVAERNLTEGDRERVRAELFSLLQTAPD